MSQSYDRKGRLADMERRILARGCLAGAVAGLVSFALARLLVTPVIDRAIRYEEGRAEAARASGRGVEIFTRGVQANVGMGMRVMTFGIAMGALLAVVSASSMHALVLSPRDF